MLTIMSTQLRDTNFGYLIRLVSRRRLLRYPDEIDPSLWKLATQRPSESTGSQKDAREGAVTGDDGEEVYLVGWYGPDDPEVSLQGAMVCSICHLLIKIRIQRTGPALPSS